MPLVRYNYSFIKKAELTGKKLNQIKLYLADNTTYTTHIINDQDVAQMHADLLNDLIKPKLPPAEPILDNNNQDDRGESQLIEGADGIWRFK